MRKRWYAALLAAALTFVTPSAARADIVLTWAGYPTASCATGTIDSFVQGGGGGGLQLEATLTPCSQVMPNARFGYLYFYATGAYGRPIQPYVSGAGPTHFSVYFPAPPWTAVTALCITNTQNQRTACLGNDALGSQIPVWTAIPGTDPRLRVPYRGPRITDQVPDPNCATCVLP